MSATRPAVSPLLRQAYKQTYASLRVGRGGTSTSASTPAKPLRRVQSSSSSSSSTPPPPSEGEGMFTNPWSNAKLWGGFGAAAGWGMSGAAIYDASQSGPEIISLNMTGVLIVYSSLFARWAYVVKPQNMMLCACHVTNVLAQANQMKRGLEYKAEQGGPAGKEEVDQLMKSAGVAGAVGAVAIAGAPAMRTAVAGANLPFGLSAMVAGDAGPFTVHFWAPMSKWLISGASFMDLDRPTDKISVAQFTALTATGFFFSRYALLVKPINYVLCSVNIALFGSSAYHLTRKIKADYL
uniref:Mitochondrial pyruvate carrier n=1 Tax=Corethron hystrix TaxID=216773 RepID=A0A7S1G1J7_9STRA